MKTRHMPPTFDFRCKFLLNYLFNHCEFPSSSCQWHMYSHRSLLEMLSHIKTQAKILRIISIISGDQSSTGIWQSTHQLQAGPPTRSPSTSQPVIWILSLTFIFRRWRRKQNFRSTFFKRIKLRRRRSSVFTFLH